MRTTSRLSVLVWYWGPLAVYAGAIFVLSSMPHPPVPALPISYADKLLHALEYSGLGCLLCRALALGGRGFSGRTAVAATIGLGALYGASDELHQLFVPARSADVLDWVADVIGASAGAVLYHRARLRPVGASAPQSAAGRAPH